MIDLHRVRNGHVHIVPAQRIDCIHRDLPRHPQPAGGAADVGEAGSLSRVRRMYVPDKGRAQLIEGDAAAKARRLAEIIREFKGDAA